MAEGVHDLHTFMAQVTDEIGSEYKRIFARSPEDPGTAGDEGEENWATVLREWLPPNYHVETKGRLIGHDGRMSPQIDLLVLKPSYPKKLREKKVWLADGVAAAFECKTTLRSEHIVESVSRAIQFKDLVRKREGTPAAELISPLLYGILAHSHDWKKPNSKPADNVTKIYEKASLSVKHPKDLIDLICVSDLGTWNQVRMTLHRGDIIPEIADRLMAQFGGVWGVTTAMSAATNQTHSQADTFTPIGAMVAVLTQALARNDVQIRDIADYYVQANLGGQGGGFQRHWPISVYSEIVQQQLPGRVVNEASWNEWSVALL